MPDMRKRFLPVVLLALCLALTGCYDGLSKKRIVSLVHENHREIEQAIESGNAKDWNGKKGIRDVTLHDHGFVEFFCAGAGMGPNTSYYGFYYSPDGVPYDFWGGNEPLTETKNGWKWQEEQGDNTFYTEQITDTFYYYEYHF